MEEPDHKFNFNKVKILHTEQFLVKRKLAEIFLYTYKNNILIIKKTQRHLDLKIKRLSIKITSYNSITS